MNRIKILFLALLICLSISTYAQVGIGTVTPNASAALDINSTSGGLLPPRMTYEQKATIASPVAGLFIWCSNCGTNGELQVYNGSTWTNMVGNTASVAKPSAPTSVVATASNAQASVAFTAPTSNGGSAITGYTVTSSPDNITASGSSSPIVVTGLTNGTSYTFTVIATNTAGNSVASSSSASVMPKTVPDAPTNVIATSGNLIANVAFTAPISNGGSTITSYRVTSDPGNFIATGATSPIQITGLTNGISYTFTVVAINSEGDSSPSDASSAITPSFVCGTATVTFTYRGSQVTYGTAVGANSRCWLDRNLGATQVATSSTDTAAYGDLFQWGRGDDGHQSRSSATTTTLSSTDTPGHGNFIVTTPPQNWLDPFNSSLWQGGDGGTNNPCPSGFRLPTVAEWTTEGNSWSSNGGTKAAGAIASNLKLPLGGMRYNGGNGSLNGTEGIYWTSSNTNSTVYQITVNYTSFGNWNRSYGLSTRCIKN